MFRLEKTFIFFLSHFCPLSFYAGQKYPYTAAHGVFWQGYIMWYSHVKTNEGKIVKLLTLPWTRIVIGQNQPTQQLNKKKKKNTNLSFNPQTIKPSKALLDMHSSTFLLLSNLLFWTCHLPHSHFFQIFYAKSLCNRITITLKLKGEARGCIKAKIWALINLSSRKWSNKQSWIERKRIRHIVSFLLQFFKPIWFVWVWFVFGRVCFYSLCSLPPYREGWLYSLCLVFRFFLNKFFLFFMFGKNRL